MGKYNIDLTDVHYVPEMHERIKDGLRFPDYYGKNLDALWDCITDMEAPIEIRISGTEKLGKEMKTFFEKIMEVFKEAKIWFEDSGEDFEVIIEKQVE